MTGPDIEKAASLIVAARTNKLPLPALTDTVAITMEQAYGIQAAVTRRRIASGQKIVGWKLGYTSQAMREQMNVDQMNFGPLTDAMALPNQARLPRSAVQPLVEPEIAFVMARSLRRSCDVAEVLSATAEVHACLEVVDPIWIDRRFRIEDNTADGSSAAFFVLGDPLRAQHLPDIKVNLRHDDTQVATATGVAADGHPARTVAWLAARLSERGERLRAGDIVLTGGLTKAIPLEPGHRVSAEFSDGAGSVSVSVAR